MLTLPEARALIAGQARPITDCETLALTTAHKRFVAMDCAALVDVPPAANSAMAASASTRTTPRPAWKTKTSGQSPSWSTRPPTIGPSAVPAENPDAHTAIARRRWRTRRRWPPPSAAAAVIGCRARRGCSRCHGSALSAFLRRPELLHGGSELGVARARGDERRDRHEAEEERRTKERADKLKQLKEQKTALDKAIVQEHDLGPRHHRPMPTAPLPPNPAPALPERLALPPYWSVLPLGPDARLLGLDPGSAVAVEGLSAGWGAGHRCFATDCRPTGIRAVSVAAARRFSIRR